MSRSVRGRGRVSLAIATNNGDMGGGEVMLLNIATALRGMGIDVTVLAPTTPGELLDEARTSGFDVVPLKASSRPGYMCALASWRLRNRAVPLWCNGLVPTVATTGMGPRIAHLHILPTGINALAARIGRLGATTVLVPSRFMASRVRGTRVLENWTEDITFRARVPRPEGPLRVGFLGRLTKDKGVHVLAHAMAEVIARSEREVRLVLAGENRFGDSADDREIHAALEPLVGSVDRLGWVRREEFFDQVDLAVFPSVWEEPFGLVAAEAMAQGVPFVISDAGALPEVVGPAHPWVAGRGDEGALAEMILALIGELDEGGVQRGARRRWEERFSPAAGAGRVAELLLDLGQAAGTRRAGGRRDV
ncbi:glycosyltransferase family 4 protein [Brachybacterium sp. p3-SID1565]|uniref:glycosyltransferase family 4 protein n=1 Tax=Brachybacterium sp. p3-SID1565 TaxID=2916046 RepID=UPI0021A87544|nr:glycosyltransferase family 4 protein [Brachybacterium sp. p3-SID1565]MCT1385967.1 glycosyltransferase family 4 protein [Brachybacterium sp. p3-SID1565]